MAFGSSVVVPHYRALNANEQFGNRVDSYLNISSIPSQNLEIGQRIFDNSSGAFWQVKSGSINSSFWQAQFGDDASKYAEIVPVFVKASVTLNVPSDFSTLQEAVNFAYGRFNLSSEIVDIVIGSGHSPASGVAVTNGDYGFIRISSIDAEVLLSALFPQSGVFISAENANAPVLNCLVNAGGNGTGYQIHNNSRGYVTAGNGVKNTWADGLAVRYGSVCCADDTIWTGAAQNGSTGSGIISWASLTSAERADVSGSGYYGAQAAHGGSLGFKDGIASGATRYGLRASDGANIDADGATANSCGIYGVYAFNGCNINFTSGTATGNTTANIVAVNGSKLCARSVIATGSLGDGIICISSVVDLFGGNVSSAAGYGINASGCGIVHASGANCNSAGIHGVLAENQANVNFIGGNASNCTLNGVSATDVSTVNAEGATLDDCGQYGVASWYGASVNLRNGFARRAATRGIYAFSGGKIIAKGANCRKVDLSDTSGASGDIVCVEGSEIIAHGAVGGVSKAVNTLDTDGVIYQ